MTQGKHSPILAAALAIVAVALAVALSAAVPGPAQALSPSSSTAVSAQDSATPSITYRAKMKTSGWTGWVSNNAIAGTVANHERLKSFQVTLDPGKYDGAVKYRVRLNSGKWKAWKTGGTAVATSSTIEALQVVLTGTIAEKYDIVYRVYVHGIGWQRRMRNGETAGTTGRKLQIEALRIQLVSKSKTGGWVESDGSWSFYKSGKKVTGAWIDTKESPIDEALTGSQRYWLDANGNLAVNRFVNPAAAADSKAGCTAFATWSGNIARGKYESDIGLLLANGTTGALHTKTRWLTTKKFDGKKQRYRLVKKGVAAVAKTGLFTVKGKKYYGYTDGLGYILRSDIHWVDGKWYKANSKGVLKKYSKKNVIERYVKWAVKIAKDDSHGYSQANRWGPDYDCSSLVCAALKAVGFPDSGASWTGNMKSCLKKIGFKWHKGTSGLRRGDILLVHNKTRQHTEIYLGNGKNVGAHIAETGGITGKTGDQTGNEISVTNYYNAPWQGYLRYKG